MTDHTWQQHAVAALQALPANSKPLSKAEKFRQLLPAIEQQIADGTPQADIAAALSASGLTLSLEMFRNYLSTARKRVTPPKGPAHATPASAATTQPAPPASTPPANVAPATPARGWQRQRGQAVNW